jgi:hypothetical protein
VGYSGITEERLAPGQVVGYSGITAEGAPFTGQAPVQAPSPTTSSGLRQDASREQGENRTISYELKDAWKLPPPANPPPGLTKAEAQVLRWLQDHSSEIEGAEAKWQVDRRAIAGAIAWEALRNVPTINVQPPLHIGRASGPGKVHYSDNRSWGEGNPLSRQVERAGYLPRVSMDQRREILATSPGAIDYIGASMSAFSDIAASSGHQINIRRLPEILTSEYNGDDLDKWQNRLNQKAVGTAFTPGNEMGIWVAGHLTYLEAAVGTPDPGMGTHGLVGPPLHAN